MDAANRVKLARYHNARGIRMVKCKKGVETCGHKRAFEALAAEAFEARDHQMQMVRVEMGRRKRYEFKIVIGWDVVAYAVVCDELEAGGYYEAQCETLGVPPGEHMVQKGKRTRWPRMIFGEVL